MVQQFDSSEPLFVPIFHSDTTVQSHSVRGAPVFDLSGSEVQRDLEHPTGEIED